MLLSRRMNLSGEAPVDCTITVIDDEGRVVGETKTDTGGKWNIKAAPLIVGDHTIRAIAKNEHGRVWESPHLEITVEAPSELGDGTGGLSSEAWKELNDLREERRIRADERYADLVIAVSEGFEVANGEGEFILEAAGKSIGDFERDLGKLNILVSKRELQELTWHTQMEPLRDQ